MQYPYTRAWLQEQLKREDARIPMVYALRLEHRKYYVGFSRNIYVRLYYHFNGKGAKWTQLHLPIAVITMYEGDEEEELALTALYIVKYGADNVRGGPFCAVDPSINAWRAEQLLSR